MAETWHICWTRYNARRLVVQHCHGKCARRRRMLAEHQDWYGWQVTCLTCGDQWTDGEMHPRPFQRGWRADNVKHAREAWRTNTLPKVPPVPVEFGGSP